MQSEIPAKHRRHSRAGKQKYGDTLRQRSVEGRNEGLKTYNDPSKDSDGSKDPHHELDEADEEIGVQAIVADRGRSTAGRSAK